MSDDRWGWVTAPASTKPQPPVHGVEKKQHFTNTPSPGAGRDALSLWAPTPEADPTPPAEAPPADDAVVAYSAVDPTTTSLEVGGHGPGDDAPTAQWPVVSPAAADQNWTDQWQPAGGGDDLDQLVVAGRARKARTRSLRRAGIVAAFALLLGVIIAVGAVLILPGDGDSPPAAQTSAGSAPEGWCATGTNGDTTTVATDGDQKTPTGAVAAFLSGLIDTRSAAAARAAMSPAATTPTLDQLQAWIGGLPPATNGWCAQITTTDSAARVLVALRLHARANPIAAAPQSTFYVSATSPTSWSIDAIVSDEGSQP